MNENDVIARTTPKPGPHGLGGMLWLFGVPLMLWGSAMVSLLPLVAWSFTPAELEAARAMAMKHGVAPSEFSIIPAHALPRIIAVLSGILVAEAFFSRSSHFRWLATVWLLALYLLRWHDGWILFPGGIDPQEPMALWVEALAGTAFVVPILYLWLSRRCRNTFSSQALPSHRTGLLRAFLNGPRDWRGGVWCVAGAIVLLAWMHTTLAMAHRPYFFPPELTPEIIALLNAPAEAPARSGGNAASALMIGSYRDELGQVPYARLFLALHVAGLLLALWSVQLFVRRASILRPALIASSLFLVSAHGLYWLMDDQIPVFCVYCGHFDAPDDHLAKSLSLFVAVIALLLLPAVRQRFRSTPVSPSSL